MEKEFIQYEQALALKELGFDEPCLGFRKEDGIFEFFGTPDRDNSNTMFGFYPTAPLYQQTFRWFKEKYGLYSQIGRCMGIVKEAYFVEIHTLQENLGIYDENEEQIIFNSSEIAEFESLKKLIEIVKEQK